MTSNQEYSQLHFSIPDYCVFGALLLFSTGIGIYFGYIRKKPVKPSDDEELKDHNVLDFGSKGMSEYMLGSRQMKVFPVAMSLVASYISGGTMLGTPSEIYNYGTQYWLIIISVILMAIVVSKVYMPVFSALRVSSSYEYLETRFGASVRTIAAVLFIVKMIVYMPIIVYVPALAFNQVTGINVYITSSVVSLIVVIYTILGGIKAVVQTDIWQTLVMFIGIIVVVILGLIWAGGFGPVFQHAAEGGRIIFANVTPSLYERQSFWAVLIGGFFYWTSYNSVNQAMVQRYMSLPTLKKAQHSMIIFTISAVIFVSFCCFAGLLIFDYYRNCDPLSVGFISNTDQLLPIYVMQTVGHLQGIPGLFIAGVFGAGLSSLSLGFNSTALVIFEDIVRGSFAINLSERASKILVNFVIIIHGVIAVALIFVLEKLSGILSVVSSLVAIESSTTCGIFTLGMLVPWSTTKGALAGAAAGAIMSGWVSFGTQAATASGQLGSHMLEVFVSECPNNSTITVPGYVDESDVFPLYRLSYHWIPVIGVLSTLLVGTVTSFLCGPKDLKTLDAVVISPVIHRFLPKECFNATPTASPTLSRGKSERTSTYISNNSKHTSATEKY
ncbi:PREDICTED: sodium-coupled monocarboxylate transporter 2-like isoform X2 [Bactrocera latifrons]|uniref:sodium-coupled monocarboxylate transporter 2-like isoform X2 n=1 Tax=Bactrocera latifrons TaxID=174628 RepID=UPI0008DDF21D|nr:PREDICTED: sodium-coupled monocarboxylate transporter 2-like isoform X2 [Bactrocera latifrons]